MPLNKPASKKSLSAKFAAALAVPLPPSSGGQKQKPAKKRFGSRNTAVGPETRQLLALVRAASNDVLRDFKEAYYFKTKAKHVETHVHKTGNMKVMAELVGSTIYMFIAPNEIDGFSLTFEVNSKGTRLVGPPPTADIRNIINAIQSVEKSLGFPLGKPSTESPQVFSPRQAQVHVVQAMAERVDETRRIPRSDPTYKQKLADLKTSINAYVALRGKRGLYRDVYKQGLPYYMRGREILKADQKQAAFVAVPKKRNLRELATRWTLPGYQQAQAIMRGRENRLKNITIGQVSNARKLTQGLQRYFKHYALRSPTMPPGEFVNGTSRYLYRGIHQTNDKDSISVDAIMRSGTYVEKGYIATTRRLDTAVSFAKGKNKGIIFVIDVFNDIPRGTPWIWYAGEIEEEAHRNFNKSDHALEAEVLLPPGRLVILGPWEKKAVGFKRVTFVRAKYVPDAGYEIKRRKGAGKDWNAYQLPSLFP